MKRVVLAVALLTALAACHDSSAPPTATGIGTSAPPASTTVTTPAPSAAPDTTSRRALRTVLTVGDGVMFDAQPALAAALAPARQVADAYFGSGLTRPEQYDWEHAWAQLVSQERPDVVVVLTGVWDARATITGDGQSLDIGSPSWIRYVSGRVSRAVEVLAASGATVVWVLPLAESDPAKSARIATVERTVRATLDGDPRVILVDGDQYLSGSSNQFLAKRSDGTVLRKNDGEHLCPAGAAALADGVRGAVATRFTINSAWDRTGAWTNDDRYRNRAEGCTS